MDKLSSRVHRVHMELGGKLLNSLRIKTQFLKRLQSVSVVDGARIRCPVFQVSLPEVYDQTVDIKWAHSFAAFV